MSRSLRQLTEQQIRKAEAEGKLSNLKGAGKPLPDRGGGDHADAVGYRMMAEAGALPEEMRLKKELADARQKLSLAEGEAAVKAASAKVAGWLVAIAVAVTLITAFLAFNGPQQSPDPAFHLRVKARKIHH